MMVLLILLCIVELFVLLIDKGRFIRYVYSIIEIKRKYGFIKGFFIVTNKIFSSFYRAIKKNILIESDKKKKTHVDVAIRFEGGFGDILLHANWYAYFREYFITDNVIVHIFCPEKTGTAIFGNQIPQTFLCNSQDFCEDKWDVTFSLIRTPVLLHANEPLVQRLSPKFYEYILLVKKYMAENELINRNVPFLDGFSGLKCIVQGKKRIQQADIYGKLGITEEYKHFIFIKENEKAYLSSLGLLDGFITIHRGWDSVYSREEHVKGWSLKSCGDIISKLKERFPQYKIVLFGTSEEQAPCSDGADVNLIGKTTLEQVKVLLKHAACHIDNEGGMVHLRHALHGGASVVMFGPTSVDFFGYSENTNIVSSVCSHWCEWISKDWMFTCAKTGMSGHPCMDAITSDDVLLGVEKVLSHCIREISR